MKKQTLLILEGEPLNFYYKKKYSVLLKQNQINLKILNILPILKKKIYNQYFDNKNIKIFKNKKFIDIYNLNQFFKLVKKLPKNYFYINQAPKTILCLFLEKYLQKKGGKKIFHRANGLPFETIGLKKKINFFFSNLNLKSPFIIINKLLVLIENNLKKFLEVKPLIYFIPNPIWKKTLNNIDKKKIKLVHDYEIDVFKKTKKNKKKKVIVFIDQMIDKTFDSALYSFFPTSFMIRSDSYWKKIDDTLDFLEKKTGLKAVVAGAHRRSPEDIPTKKRVIFNRTPELIMQSKLVLGHNSTALHYAVLFKKPIILLKMKDFKNNLRILEILSNFTKLLGCKIIETDHLHKFKDKGKSWFFEINNNKYIQFLKANLNFKKNNKNNIWTSLLNEINNKKSILYNNF